MFLVAGESLIDMVVQPDGSYMPIAGGAPFNFARALALQGLPSGYLNPFSEDAFGVLLREALQRSGAQHFGGTSTKPTSLAFVATDAHEQQHYSFYREHVADREIAVSSLDQGEGVTAFHTGGLALLPPDDAFALAALSRFRGRGSICTLDVNVRPQAARSMNVALARYREAALAAIAAADIVKASEEDLLHLGFTASAQAAARELLTRGCRLVVLTMGSAGAWALSGANELFQPAQAVRVVDTVGAGDCFFAGFIAALCRAGALRQAADGAASEEMLQQALVHATRCATLNLGRQGCAPPTWDKAQSLQLSAST